MTIKSKHTENNEVLECDFDGGGLPCTCVFVRCYWLEEIMVLLSLKMGESSSILES